MEDMNFREKVKSALWKYATESKTITEFLNNKEFQAEWGLLNDKGEQIREMWFEFSIKGQGTFMIIEDGTVLQLTTTGWQIDTSLQINTIAELLSQADQITLVDPKKNKYSHKHSDDQLKDIWKVPQGRNPVLTEKDIELYRKYCLFPDYTSIDSNRWSTINGLVFSAYYRRNNLRQLRTTHVFGHLNPRSSQSQLTPKYYHGIFEFDLRNGPPKEQLLSMLDNSYKGIKNDEYSIKICAANVEKYIIRYDQKIGYETGDVAVQEALDNGISADDIDNYLHNIDLNHLAMIFFDAVDPIASLSLILYQDIPLI